MATITKFANANTVVTTGWTNPTNAYADDGTYTTCAPGKSSSVTTDYGFPAFTTSDIPSGSTINSVTAEFQYKTSATGVTGELVGIQLNNNGTLLDSESTFTPAVTDTTQTKANTTAVSQASLQTANQFKVRVRGAKGNTNTAVTLSVDYVKLTVDYTPPNLSPNAPTLLTGNNPSSIGLYETFDAASRDTTKWSQFTNGSTSIAQTSGELVCTLVGSTVGSNYVGYDSLTTNYNLTGLSVSVKVATVASTSTHAQTYLKLIKDASNALLFIQENGTLYAQKIVATVTTTLSSATYSSTTHKYWRIRESGGTTFWDISTDGSTWTNFTSASNPITVTALQVEIAAGTYQSETSPGTAHFDNFNVVDPYIFSITTPTVEFTDTDPDSLLADSFSESNVNANELLSGTKTQAAQSFTGDGRTLDNVQFYLRAITTLSGSATAYIYTHSGTFGSTGVPTGSALATSDPVDLTGASTSYSLRTFTFSGVNRINLVNGTKYFVAVEWTNANQLGAGFDNTSPTASGNYASLTSGTWTAASGTDLAFYVYTKDTLSYQIQIDTTNTFDSSTSSIIDQYPTANTPTNIVFSPAGNTGVGQSFTSIGSVVNVLKVKLLKTGTPTGNAVAKIYAHSGTFGTSSLPTGTALATSDNFDVSTLTTSLSQITFNFTGTNRIWLENGTKYVFTIEYSTANTISIACDNAGTATGNLVFFTSGAWNSGSSGQDVLFELDGASPLIDRLSASDAGFTDVTGNGATLQASAVTNGYVDNVAATSTSITLTATAGDTLIAAIRVGSGSGTVTLSDDKSNNWQLAKSQVATGDHTLNIYYAENVAAGSTVITLATVSSVSHRWGVERWSRLKASSSLDQTNSAQSSVNGTTADSGNITTTQGVELLIGAVATANQVLTSATANNSFTKDGAGNKVSMAYRAVTSTLTTAANYSGFTSDQWTAVVASFKALGPLDPFPSGDTIDYTIQAGDALTNGVTYYLRVRAKDPSGSNTFGSWSSIRSLTISSGTTTVSITKTMIYSVKRTPTAPTKSLKYTVKTTPSAATKSLQYAIKRTASAITKSLKYTVIKTISTTKSLKYTTKVTPSALTKSLRYTIKLTPSAITKSLKYSVKPTISITKSLKYTIKTTPSTLIKSLRYAINKPTAITKSLKYTLKVPVAITKSLKYTIIKSLSVTKSLKYSLKTTPSAINKSLKYSIKTTPSAITKSLRYAVKPTISITKSLKYTIKAPVSITKSLEYTIKTTPSALTKSLRYAVKPTISLTKTLKYTLKTIPSPITKSLRYTLAPSTAITKSLKYTVKAPAAITKSLKYTIKTTASVITKSLRYAIKTNLAITKSLRYAVKPTFSITKSLRYTVKTTPSAITKSLKYSINASISITKSLQYVLSGNAHDLTKSLKYTVKTTLALTKGLIYEVKTATTITKSLVYRVKFQTVNINKSLSYAIRTNTAITKSLKYSLKVSTAITKSLKYSIKAPIVITKSLKYTVKVSVAISKSLKYSLKTTPSAIIKSFKYSIKAPVAVTKALTYQVKITPSAITKSLKYSIKKSQTITKSLIYIIPTSGVDITKNLSYSIKKTYSLIRSLSYSVKKSTNLTKGLIYMVTKPTSITRSLSYKIKAPASLTKALTYTVKRSAISLTKALVYRVVKSYSLTKSLQYSIKDNPRRKHHVSLRAEPNFSSLKSDPLISTPEPTVHLSGQRVKPESVELSNKDKVITLR